jgi:hypothetical protein
MRDREAHLEKLRNDSEECALMTKLAANLQKRELFSAHQLPGASGIRGRAFDCCKSSW